jgi:Cu/Ag efflux protein CusF
MSAGLSVLASTLAIRAQADDKAGAAEKEKQWKGTVLAIDAKEKTLRAKGPLWARTFNLAGGCAFMIGERNAKLDEFRPGQKVRVTYKDAGGVLVATRVAQEKLVYTGTVQELDAKARVLTLKQTVATKRFRIAEDCKVILKDDKPGALDGIQTGQRVAVVYEIPGDLPVARQIEQRGSVQTGTLTAIDASSKSVKARHLMGEMKFNLADDCQIVVNGKSNGQLSDLRLGQKVTLTYDEVDGVKVLTHLAPVPEARVTETAKAAK